MPTVRSQPLLICLQNAENGEFLVVMDDESRENEGDLMLPAQFATTEKFAFLVRHSR
jgi:3,4-dihydroxy 2-butanone 4-phosphate synthase